MMAAEDVDATHFNNPFFAFCIDTHDAKKRDLEQQAALVKELGFDGIGHIGLARVPERLRTVNKAGLRLFLVGLRVDLTSKTEPYDPQFKEDEANLSRLLKSALPHLILVSINGANPAGKSDKNWDRLIQPLDQGTFDVYRFLVALRRHDYDGPIALMCYGIRGDAHDHLSRSMAKWRQWQNRLRSE